MNHNQSSSVTESVRETTGPEPSTLDTEHATVLMIVGTEQQKSVSQIKDDIQRKVDAGNKTVPRPGSQHVRSRSAGDTPNKIDCLTDAYRTKLMNLFQTRFEEQIQERQRDIAFAAMVNAALPQPQQKQRHPNTWKKRHDQESKRSTRTLDEPESGPDDVDHGNMIRAGTSEPIEPKEEPV